MTRTFSDYVNELVSAAIEGDSLALPPPPGERLDPMSNRQKFTQFLITAYLDLFKTDPDYSFVGSWLTAEALAEKMVKALAVSDAHLVGKGIARACKAAGIKKNRQAIIRYLGE